MKALLTSMAVAAALVTGSAFAADNLSSDSSSLSNPIYISASFGLGAYTVLGLPGPGTWVYGLGLGYQLNPNLALESGFRNYAGFSIGDDKYESNFDLDISVKGNLPKGILPAALDQFDWYGKVGVAYITSTEEWKSGSAFSQVVEHKEKFGGIAAEGAIGASYKINSQLRANLEALFVAQDMVHGVPGRDAITLGVAYSF